MTPKEERLLDFRKSVVGFVEDMPLGQFLYSMHISLRQKFVYVEVPKAGSSTIKGTLIKAELASPSFEFTSRRHIHLREFSPLLNPMQVGDFNALLSGPDIFKFCFVRNPYDRLLSGYLDKIAQPSEQRDLLCRQFGLNNPADQELTFLEFVKAIQGQRSIEMDNHWRPQFYQTFQNKIDYDFVGKTESLHADMLEVGKRLGVDFAPYLKDERNHAQSASSRLGEFMTDEIQAIILDKYRQDFEHFGYDPSLPV